MSTEMPDSATSPAASAAYPLEPDEGAMREALAAVVERVVEHVASLPLQPSWGNDDPEDVEAALVRAREARAGGRPPTG